MAYLRMKSSRIGSAQIAIVGLCAWFEARKDELL